MSIIEHVRAAFGRCALSPDDTLVLGVSGWVDSMVLLEVAYRLHWAGRLLVCHIDHKIRSNSSEDAEFVREECWLRGIRCEIVESDIPAAAKSLWESLEATGRIVRYEFFERVRTIEKGRFILTAHHMDDSVETIIMNFTRGARLRGLSGIQELQWTLLRPLLHASKEDIRRFADAEGIHYREDPSNTDPAYIRNRIRNVILPAMETINPNVRETIHRFSLYARELDSMIEGLLGAHLSGGSIRESDFAALSPMLQRSLIEHIYADANQWTIGLSSGNIEEIRRFILEAKWGSIKEIGRLKLRKRERLIRWD